MNSDGTEHIVVWILYTSLAECREEGSIGSEIKQCTESKDQIPNERIQVHQRITKKKSNLEQKIVKKIQYVGTSTSYLSGNFRKDLPLSFTGY